MVSQTDAAEARAVGQVAVQLALRGVPSGSVVIKRVSDRPYHATFGHTKLANVARKTKPLDKKYINNAGNNILDSYLDYVAPLAGDIPESAFLV